jgi:predicted metal-dependent hydrolase
LTPPASGRDETMKASRQLSREIAEAVTRRKKVDQLRIRVRRLLVKWEPRLGVHVQTWSIKDAKSYWASTEDHEIWFAADLSSMPRDFIEVIVVHELVHQLTKGHDPSFFELMDRHLPGWRQVHARYDKVPALYSNAVMRRALLKRLNA